MSTAKMSMEIKWEGDRLQLLLCFPGEIAGNKESKWETISHTANASAATQCSVAIFGAKLNSDARLLLQQFVMTTFPRQRYSANKAAPSPIASSLLTLG